MFQGFQINPQKPEKKWRAGGLIAESLKGLSFPIKEKSGQAKMPL